MFTSLIDKEFLWEIIPHFFSTCVCGYHVHSLKINLLIRLN